MSAPIAIASVVSWFRNPVQKGKSEVKVNNLKAREYVFLFVLTCIVTVIFYFILKACNTALLIWSTVSVFTSFFAAYLTMRRCEYYALAYTANDIVLIIMWSVAAVQNKSYVSVIICFLVFLVNDLYGFFNWSKMKKAQAKL
jgi:nicotinamide mononucleotide transporter PnuC